MVTRELDDGVRIAQLLASDLVGHEGALADVTVTDADPDVDPTTDGARAYRVRDAAALGTVFVHPDRVRIEFESAPETALDAAREAGLRVRPKAVDPPRTVVFVENGAEVKRMLGVIERVVEAETG